MLVHLFRGTGRVFAVRETDGADGLPARYGPWTRFKQVELIRGQAQPGLHVDECLDDLARFGVHITDAHVRITEEAIG